MLLDLCDENQHRFDTIELTDGCFPRISIDIGVTIHVDTFDLNLSSRPETSKEAYYVKSLEPAVWSILLLLDKICVDCSKRSVSWATKGIGGNEGEDEDDSSYRTQYAQDDCYDYNDDVDELFNLAQELIKLSKSRTKKNQDDLNIIKEEQYFLIRMLYCYLLPKVQIYRDDIPKVVGAIEKQTSYIEKINQDIERDSHILDGLYHVLQQQQDEWLNQFEEIANTDNKCTRKFLKILDKHLNKRIDQLNDQLEEYQSVVNNIKDIINTNGTNPEKERELDAARRETTICHQTLQRVLIVSRDTIKTALLENEFLDEDCVEIVLNYLESSDMLVKQKKTANRQMDKKVRATSILENLKRIKEEIEVNGVAGSTVHSSSGHRPTDVLPGTQAPEYQTLSERVSAIVQDNEHPLGMEFQKFVSSIKEKCQNILKQPADVVECPRKTKQIDNYIVVSKDGTIKLEYYSILEDLAFTIRQHFLKMALCFQHHFNNTSYVIRNKLQLCYEDNFYKKVGKDITEIYCMVHQHHQRKMISDLEEVTKLPIKCLELGMKDEWWLELFEKRRKVIISSRCSSCEKLSESPPDFVSSSSPSSSDSMPATNSLTPRRERTPSKIRRFFDFMRRESKVVSGIYGNDCNGNDCNGNDCNGNSSNGPNGPNVPNDGSTGDLNEYEWISAKFALQGENLEDTSGALYQADLKKFEEYFGPSLECLQSIFQVPPILGKLQCLTSSLRKVTLSVQELRRQVLKSSAAVNVDSAISLAITGDDMLPLIVLMVLQLDPNDAAALQGQLKMMQDLIPEFLSAGCHGWALMEFQMACQVLHNLCQDFSWTDSFNHLLSSSYRHE